MGKLWLHRSVYIEVVPSWLNFSKSRGGGGQWISSGAPLSIYHNIEIVERILHFVLQILGIAKWWERKAAIWDQMVKHFHKSKSYVAIHHQLFDICGKQLYFYPMKQVKWRIIHSMKISVFPSLYSFIKVHSKEFLPVLIRKVRDTLIPLVLHHKAFGWFIPKNAKY